MNSRPSRSELRAKGEEVVAAAVDAVIRTTPALGGSDVWEEVLRLRFESIPDQFEQFASRDPELLDIAILNMEDATKWLAGEARGRIAEVQISLQDWQGSAAVVFRKDFTTPFPTISYNHITMAFEVKGALEAQVKIIEKSRRDVLAVGDHAISTLNKLERDTSGNWLDIALAVVGAVAAVAGGIASAVGGAVGAPVTGGASAVVGWSLVSAAVGMVSAALPSQEGPVSSAEEVIATMIDALARVAQATANEEEILAQALRADVGMFNPNGSDLALPKVTLSADSADRFEPPAGT